MSKENENTNNQLSVISVGGSLVTTQDAAAIKEFRLKCQGFIEKLNTLPPDDSIGETSDKKAHTIFISHIETTLDEYFFGLWETDNFRWSVISNEVVGAIDLIFYHPVTGLKMKRQGAAAIQIMVDRVPEDIKDNPQEKNRWALNPDNKKSGALDMGFPKLKSECVKNAANSLGKMFGRDLNRKVSDNFQGILRPDAKIEITEELKEFINMQIDADELTNIYVNNPALHANPEFFQLITAKKQSLLTKK